MISFIVLAVISLLLSILIGQFVGFIFEKMCQDIIDNTLMGWKIEMVTILFFATLTLISEIVIPVVTMTIVLS